ncbi:saccharopine dehydrogenase family protein [Aestuariispira insulae]|uniref:Saccharopine dehydrogenase-like NADP-dependent oxidoreductase n=1 Tax=Aestuariispira insulae TaxID=1461337 RepID=A0A3D9HMN7_9PROT|nr:saccharopine dehydrogenase family protein [Aestuariispira insulae]RED50753.1 saccharopine dehydrogenase-like NADP-dependent oxidoreductase [Aestuariispira insulae]
MKEILLIGSGKIGEVIADLLCNTGDYAVTIADQSESQLNRIEKHKNLSTLVLDASSKDELVKAMAGKFAVLSAAPFFLTKTIAGAAKDAGIHYFDLTEDVASTDVVKELAKDANSTFIPQCGLAPGFISIVAYDLAKKFDELDTVRMRVGALPKYPSNRLNYNLTWSTEGVINEYCNPCDAIVEGELQKVPALEELEEFSLDGIRYEAFNTSGGLGTLCETLKDKVKYLNYRSVRYPGHRDVMKLLIEDLKLNERRGMLKDIFEYALPVTMQDVVLIFVTVSGKKNGMLVQETYANKVYSRAINGRHRSAIQITTASGICAVVDMLAKGDLPQKGFVKQEDISLDTFLANRFGKNYAKAEEQVVLAAAAE